MIPGEFVGSGQAVGGTPTRFASAVLPRLAADPVNDRELVCLDLVQVSLADNPHDWTWVALSEAGVYTWGHTIGLNLKEPWRFVTWKFGAPASTRWNPQACVAPRDGPLLTSKSGGWSPGPRRSWWRWSPSRPAVTCANTAITTTDTGAIARDGSCRRRSEKRIACMASKTDSSSPTLMMKTHVSAEP